MFDYANAASYKFKRAFDMFLRLGPTKEPSMKTVVTGIVLGIVFSITLIFVNRAFASLPPTPPSQLDTLLR